MVIELRNVSKSYRKDNKDIKILSNLNYKFKKGKFYCISGRSGSGKTTLIRMLGLISNVDDGELIINNKNVTDYNDNEKCNMRNEEIGFVFQNYYLNPLMTVRENIELPMYLNKKINKDKRVNELLKLVDIKDRETHFPRELSGGEQQRVAIARALSNNPSIILADEPTGSLDFENEERILDLLKKLSKEGKCVIVVSHNPRTKEYADINLKIVNHNLVEEENEK